MSASLNNLSVKDIVSLTVKNDCAPYNPGCEQSCSHPIEVTVKDGRKYCKEVTDDQDMAALIQTVQSHNNTNSVKFLNKHYSNIRIFTFANDCRIERAEAVALSIFENPVTTQINKEEQKLNKEEQKSSNWKSTLKKVAIIAAIIIAAIVLGGGLITGFVFTAIYCPVAAYIIGGVIGILAVKAVALGIFAFFKSRK